MSKQVKSIVKLTVPAGTANPSSVGSALGPHGINIMEFCKGFNDQATAKFEQGMLVPAIITVYQDRSFTFVIKTPPASALIKKVLGLKKASTAPGTETAATMTLDQMKEVAKIKQPDLSAATLYSALKSVAGTARSMGIATPEFSQKEVSE